MNVSPYASPNSTESDRIRKLLAEYAFVRNTQTDFSKFYVDEPISIADIDRYRRIISEYRMINLGQSAPPVLSTHNRAPSRVSPLDELEAMLMLWRKQLEACLRPISTAVDAERNRQKKDFDTRPITQLAAMAHQPAAVLYAGFTPNDRMKDSEQNVNPRSSYHSNNQSSHNRSSDSRPPRRNYSNGNGSHSHGAPTGGAERNGGRTYTREALPEWARIERTPEPEHEWITDFRRKKAED